MDLVQVEAWAGVEGLRHGFTGRRGGLSECYGDFALGAGELGGELNLGFTKEDEAEAVRGNRAAVLAAVGGDEMAMVKQVHSARVVRVGKGFGQGLVEADGMVTDEAGVLLAVQAADCVPVIVADRRLRAAGAFHAGWRGTAAGIVRVGIEAMVREFGCRVEDLWVAVGPSIGACCYEVGGEVLGAFDASLFEERGGRVYLDLWEANRGQAVAMGVPEGQVWVAGECTRCSRVEGGGRRYFSHRGDAGRTGRGVGCVGWGY